MKSLILLAVLFTSCSLLTEESIPDRQELFIKDPFFQGRVVFRKLSNKKGFKILLINVRGEITDQTIFNYSSYQFDTADVNHDGKTDILVGLIKSTEFDPVEKKRLFILRIDEGQLRPLWLGSKVCQELVNFKPTDQGIIRTFEKTKTGNYAIGQYAWQSFGLALINYTHNEISYDDASKIFKN